MERVHVAIVPVKRPGVGKSRLDAVPNRERGRLAVAFATDALRACLRARNVAEVLVVTDDAGFAEYAASLGVSVTRDTEGGRGLNAALRHGAEVARGRWPRLAPFALCADLPALLHAELDAALAELDELDTRTGHVVDSHGTGTTLYAAPSEFFDPHFGPSSAAAHAARGSAAIPGALTGLRLDVDEVTDLAIAVDHGVGPATRAALRSLPWPLAG